MGLGRATAAGLVLSALVARVAIASPPSGAGNDDEPGAPRTRPADPAAQGGRELRCLDDRPVLAPLGAYQLSVEGGVAIGFFYATHGVLRFGFGRRFWDRLELEATLQLGFGDNLFSISEAARAGVLLHVSRRVEVFLGWRVGYSHVRVELQATSLWLGALWVEMLAEVRIALTPSKVLRLAPVVATGYWNEIWGFTLDPSIGIGYRF